MAVRLLVILSLLLQPLLAGAGPLACGSITRAYSSGSAEVGCCTRVALCCQAMAGSSTEDLHHCGRSAALCRCSDPAPPMPLPGPPLRSGEMLAAILPRLIAVAMELPEPARPPTGPLPTRGSSTGSDLRAFLCVWLT